MELYSKIAYKRRVAANYLDELLALLPPGAKLPGIRSMIAQSKVGRTLLEQELQRLCNNEDIFAISRQGYYKSKHSTPTQVLYLHEMVYPTTGSGFGEMLFSTIENIASQRGLKLKFVNIADKNEADLLKLLTISHAKMVFLGGQRDASRAIFIRKHARYCVEMLPRHAATLGAELRNAPATPLQMEYLFKRNYTKIAYIHQAENWNDTPLQLMRLLDYYRIMSEKHLPVYPEWVFQYTYDWESLNRNMYKLMNSTHLPEVVIAPGSCMENLYQYCANNGIKIGSELAIMSCDDTAPDLTPRPTTVTNHPAQMAEKMWSIMDALLQGKILQEQVELLIVTGETVPYRT